MNKIKLSLLAACAFMIFSCGEDDKPKDVKVTMEMVVGEDALVHGNTYTINGVDVQFTNVAFYIGDVAFKTSSGGNFTAADRYQLVRPGTFDYSFSLPLEEDQGDVTLSEVSFIVGVDDVTNAETEVDFTMRAESDPLGQQDPTMHWGWQGGYRFMSIDAFADLNGNGEFDTPLTYHLGKSDFRADINLSPGEKLEGGQNDFKLNFDVAQFLDGVDFSTEQFTKAQPDNIEIAQKVFANYSKAFSLEK